MPKETELIKSAMEWYIIIHSKVSIIHIRSRISLWSLSVELPSKNLKLAHGKTTKEKMKNKTSSKNFCKRASQISIRTTSDCLDSQVLLKVSREHYNLQSRQEKGRDQLYLCSTFRTMTDPGFSDWTTRTSQPIAMRGRLFYQRAFHVIFSTFRTMKSIQKRTSFSKGLKAVNILQSSMFSSANDTYVFLWWKIEFIEFERQYNFWSKNQIFALNL